MPQHEHSTGKSRVTGAFLSLTYDGGDISHLETVAKCVDSLGLPSTFYSPPESLLADPVSWRNLVNSGHEVGNFSLSEGANADGYLFGWTPQMVANDLEMSEQLYVDLFPKQVGRSFAYPCTKPSRRTLDSTTIQDMQHYAMLRPIVRDFFRVARTSSEGSNSLKALDLTALKCFHTSEQTHHEWVDLTEAAIENKEWIIFAFHGVGVGEDSVDAIEHARFCLWLAENRERLRIDTVWNIGKKLIAKNCAVTVRQETSKEATVR
jgi:hypothetical protein